MAYPLDQQGLGGVREDDLAGVQRLDADGADLVTGGVLLVGAVHTDGRVGVLVPVQRIEGGLRIVGTDSMAERFGALADMHGIGASSDPEQLLRMCGEQGVALVPFYAIAGTGRTAGATTNDHSTLHSMPATAQ
ncbi:hypothetical protein [Streptomyces alanosinicus]|uniref:hypothetical protein n=1 Tax=Streptomyces alanosinicus TaxID=68171 RepID=UPI0016718D07|nr:hypothetical protein [Streptomyces alanosinicus]